MELLDNFSHASLSDTATSEDVTGIIGNFVGTAGCKGLEQTDGSAEILVLVGVGHCVHLVRDLLEPGLGGFCVLDHACKSEKGLMSVSWCECVSSRKQTYFPRMTGCSESGFPKTMRWLLHFRHSSVTARIHCITAAVIAQRSWLKLLMMTWKPLSSSPKR
jgi:hypothetical protein